MGTARSCAGQSRATLIPRRSSCRAGRQCELDLAARLQARAVTVDLAGIQSGLRQQRRQGDFCLAQACADQTRNGAAGTRNRLDARRRGNLREVAILHSFSICSPRRREMAREVNFLAHDNKPGTDCLLNLAVACGRPDSPVRFPQRQNSSVQNRNGLSDTTPMSGSCIRMSAGVPDAR